MKLKPVFYIIMLLLLLTSCTVNNKERTYINNIDKLETALDSIAQQYYAIDSTGFFQTYYLINSNLSRLSSIDTTMSDLVNKYAALQKSFKRFIGEHPFILDEIGFSKKQLHTLKKDIKSGKMTEMQMENYYQEEKEAISLLMQKVSFNAQHIAYQLKSFTQLNDSIELHVNTIENR